MIILQIVLLILTRFSHNANLKATTLSLVQLHCQLQDHNPLTAAYNTLILDIVTPTFIASITMQRVIAVSPSSTPVVEATKITSTRWQSVVKPASPSTDPSQGYNMQSTTSGPTMALDTLISFNSCMETHLKTV
ncbi:hypothetical protein Pcinc_005989 [Petrolisthes cinctipes]|uniref:Uncharacterized protein n=1 Tax=Petrolisthes cinctipes TaxID=88211 RepID=A0AAE1GE42_PETCI|nr:hypothetical protein Pcinc_005989 [Petrolisthes cinctipes]